MSSLDDAFDFLSSERSESPTIREGYVKSPFGWPGGKSKSLKSIFPYLPVRTGYIEPCGGSGALLLARDESDLEVFNDRFSGITDFYKVVKDQAMREKLLAWIDLFIHSREMFAHYKETWKEQTDIVERACRWYYMLTCSFAAQGRNFGRSTRGRNLISDKWQERAPLIKEVGRRIKNVLIENQDMFQIMKDFDDHDHVFYIDPPYVNYAKGIYEYELNRSDHYTLCERIFEMKGFVALSGYSNDIYDSYDWDDRIEYDVINYGVAQSFTEENGLAGKEHLMERKTQVEVLWIKESK